MFDQGISVQYGTSNSWWGSLIAGAFSSIIAAGAAILSAFLVNRHQTQLQDTRMKTEETRARREAQRAHGEELYRLFDEWFTRMLNDTSALVRKYALHEALTAEDAKLTIGDTAKYQRIMLLAHLDFPIVKDAMNEIGQICIAMRQAAAKITTERLQSKAIETISVEHFKLIESGDRFQVVLLNAIKDIYGDNDDIIDEAPMRLETVPLSTSGQ